MTSLCHILFIMNEPLLILNCSISQMNFFFDLESFFQASVIISFRMPRVANIRFHRNNKCIIFLLCLSFDARAIFDIQSVH